MTLYHSSLRTYSPGEVVQAAATNNFYLQAVAALESSKPDRAPSRNICFFATDNLEFCYFFALKQQWPQDQINIYEVEMEHSHKAPMAIVHALQRKIEHGQETDRLVGEYWSPEKSWHFMEHFGQKMRVLRQVATPNINELLLTIKYQSDTDQASQL